VKNSCSDSYSFIKFYWFVSFSGNLLFNFAECKNKRRERSILLFNTILFFNSNHFCQQFKTALYMRRNVRHICGELTLSDRGFFFLNFSTLVSSSYKKPVKYNKAAGCWYTSFSTLIPLIVFCFLITTHFYAAGLLYKCCV